MKNRKPTRLSALLGGVVLACATTVAAQPAPPNHAQPEPGHAGTSQAPGAGMEVHIDPETGAFLSKPAPRKSDEGPPPEARERPALVERRNPSPGGGIGVAIDDRFRTSVTAEIRADGQVETGCEEHAQHDGTQGHRP